MAKARDRSYKTVQKYLDEGYRLLNETESTFTFAARRKFNVWAFILWIILANVFGLIGYLIYFSATQNKDQFTVLKKNLEEDE